MERNTKTVGFFLNKDISISIVVNYTKDDEGIFSFHIENAFITDAKKVLPISSKVDLKKIPQVFHDAFVQFVDEQLID